MAGTRWPAPAKINLALHVTGRRADGYHTLETLAVFTAFGDVLTVEPATRDGFEVGGRYAAALGPDASNLVLRARDALRTRLRAAGSGRDTPAVHIRLDKNLPVASGIGGGSSDAAAALRALATHWALPLEHGALAAIGAGLGADVPMCLAARPLVARGIGERIEALRQWPDLHLVLVNPGVAVSTAQVFPRLACRENPPLPPLPVDPDFDAVLRWLRTTRNDLQSPARSLAPAIGAALEALEASGAGFARMSGSGATCFGLYESEAAAHKAASRIAGERPEWFVVATQAGRASADDAD